MSLKIFLVFLMSLVLVICAPIPTKIIKYKVSDKYFTNNNPDKKYNHIPILDLLNQVHVHGIEHPDATLIQNSAIEIEDSKVPVEEDGIFNIFKPGTAEIEDYKSDNNLKTTNDMPHIKVHVVKEDENPMAMDIVEKFISDLTNNGDHQQQTIKITVIQDKPKEQTVNEATESVTKQVETETDSKTEDNKESTVTTIVPTTEINEEVTTESSELSTTTILSQDTTETQQQETTENSSAENIEDVIDKESFDGEQETQTAGNTATPDQFEGEVTEKSTKDSSSTETMIVQDDFVDIVKEMPDGSPVTETTTTDIDKKIESLVTEQIFQTTDTPSESKVTTTTKENLNDFDEITVVEIVDPLDIKIDNETTKMLESVRQIVEKIELQNRKKFESLHHLFQTDSDSNGNTDNFLQLKDKILHTELDTDLDI